MIIIYLTQACGGVLLAIGSLIVVLLAPLFQENPPF